MAVPIHKLNMAALHFAIIEDSPHVARIVQRCLQAFGAVRIDRFSDSVAALQSMDLVPASIILCDFHMVPLDGPAFTARLRRGRNPTIPVIMLASEPTEPMVAEARDAGINEFVAKPVEPEALWWRIYAIVDRERAFVEAQHYIGPCRRRRVDDTYDGPLRRASDPLLPPETDGPTGADEDQQAAAEASVFCE